MVNIKYVDHLSEKIVTERIGIVERVSIGILSQGGIFY